MAATIARAKSAELKTYPNGSRYVIVHFPNLPPRYQYIQEHFPTQDGPEYRDTLIASIVESIAYHIERDLNIGCDLPSLKKAIEEAR